MTTYQKPTTEQKRQWHADPSNWFLWGFYHNPEDRRLFPPKRSRLGWTVNFANPWSILATVALCAVIVAVSLLLIK